MFFGNKFGVLFTGPIVALDQQVHHVAETSGEFVLIFDEPRTMLNDPRDTGGIKVTQSITVTIIADETGKCHNDLHGSIELQAEVGDESAYHRFFLYHPKEVMIGGIGFDDDGRSLGVAVVNKDIDPVRKKWIGKWLGHLDLRHLT